MRKERNLSSEVARLMRIIEQECQAMKQALGGYAVISSHEAITSKYNALGVYQEQLEPLVGKKEALRIVFETYREVVG